MCIVLHTDVCKSRITRILLEKRKYIYYEQILCVSLYYIQGAAIVNFIVSHYIMSILNGNKPERVQPIKSRMEKF